MNSISDELFYLMALLQVPNIGNVTAKKLLAYAKSSEAIFKMSSKELMKIPGIAQVIVDSIKNFEGFRQIEEELKYIEHHHIEAIPYWSERYPMRLKHYDDSPALLFAKGKFNFENRKTVAIVGTRNASDYGKRFTDKLVAGLAPHQPIIISGMAYGIDITAHKAAIDNKIETWAVIGHGLKTVYPAIHKNYYEKVQENGGILTEYLSFVGPDRENFPQRNRIVAGLADCVVVVEAAVKGGALITATFANAYNKDVFALPGRVGDEYSEGCNFIIKTNRAHMIESIADIEYIMNWNVDNKDNKIIQPLLFSDLTDEEKAVFDVIHLETKIHLDVLALRTGFNTGKLSGLLLNMELNGVVKSLPGKQYELF